MTITAVINKIENGNAYLFSVEAGIEVCIPLDSIDNEYKEGETIILMLDKKNEN